MKKFSYFISFLFIIVFLSSCVSVNVEEQFITVVDSSIYYNDTIRSIIGPDTVYISPYYIAKQEEMPWAYLLLKIYSVYQDKVPEDYVYYIDARKMYETIGDPFTFYVPYYMLEDYLSWFEVEQSKLFGIQVGVYNDTVFVVKVLPNSPADLSGLKSGDKILEVNGYPVKGDLSLFQFLTQDDDIDYSFVIKRDNIIDTIDIYKDLYSIPVCYSDSITPDIGYIYLSTFIADSQTDGGSTSEQLKKALEETEKFKVVILDLRGNPGGYITEAQNSASLFLDPGDTIIKEVYRDYDTTSYTEIKGVWGESYLTAPDSPETGLFKDRKIVLLADGGTASASEILITALRYNKGYPLVGQTTYGKGIGQGSFINDLLHSAAHITMIKLYTPAGDSYHQVGIEPDYPVDSLYDNFQDLELLTAIKVADSIVKAESGVLAKLSSTSITEDPWINLKVEGINYFNSLYKRLSPKKIAELGFLKVPDILDPINLSKIESLK